MTHTVPEPTELALLFVLLIVGMVALLHNSKTRTWGLALLGLGGLGVIAVGAMCGSMRPSRRSSR